MSTVNASKPLAPICSSDLLTALALFSAATEEIGHVPTLPEYLAWLEKR